MKFAFASALIVSAAMLYGCAAVPGQHVSSSKYFREDDSTAGRVEIVPITPKLIAMDNSVQGSFSVPQELLDYRPGAYRIGAGDTLYITVWEHPELTSPAGPQQQTLANGRLVGPDGTLFYPYAGVIKAEGMTIADLRKEISQRLADWVENPQVDVTIIGFGSQRVSFSGAFIKTDAQAFDVVPLTLARAMGSATINTEQADLSDLVLSRDGHDYHLDLDAMSRGPKSAKDIYLKAGDQVYLPYNDRHEAYILGEVNKPGSYTFKISNLTLTQALSRAGGLNQTTSKGKAVYIIRGMKDMESDPAQVFQLDARSPFAFAMADQFRVKAGDVIFVGAAGVTRWSRLLAQLVPLSGLINNAANANYNLERDR